MNCRIRLYEEGKKIKWLFFPYEMSKSQIYLIQGLNVMLPIEDIINITFDVNKKLDIEKNIYNFSNKKISSSLK